jgi:small subunit ribosomal protein S6
MALYEVTFVARQDISTGDVDKLVETYSKLITDMDGKIIKTEHWGLRNLAYIINKNRKGHYVMFAVDAPFATISEVERRMKLNEDVIRILIIKVDAIDPEPSAMMNMKSGDEEILNLEINTEVDVENVELENVVVEENE